MIHSHQPTIFPDTLTTGLSAVEDGAMEKNVINDRHSTEQHGAIKSVEYLPAA